LDLVPTRLDSARQVVLLALVAQVQQQVLVLKLVQGKELAQQAELLVLLALVVQVEPALEAFPQNLLLALLEHRLLVLDLLCYRP
jgi:hypothetical protein